MRKSLGYSNLWIMVGVDSILVMACYYLAYLIRFEFEIPAVNLTAFQRSWYFVIPMKIGVFALFRLYKGMWRYTSLVDLVNVTKAVFTSSLLVILFVLMVYHFHGFPRSVFLMDGFLTFLAIGGIRAAIRLYFARGTGVKLLPALHRGLPGKKRLLIIGAGNAGEKVLRELRDNPGLNLEAAGFLDDDPGKQGKAIHGVPVLGTVDQVHRLRTHYDEILIAIPSARGEEMRRIVEACERTGNRYRTVPGIGELINGKISVKTIREVTLEDLIGREEVHINQAEIANYLRERQVLVTGAGGSIGSELIRQAIRFRPESITFLEVNEFNLFKVEMECRQRFPDVPTRTFLADIRDRDAVFRIFRQVRPDVVFHAAAYKHVSIQEMHPWEAVFNNVLGTRNVLEAAGELEAERFVLVSTDKAVRPANVMGATKRVAEMLTECLNGTSSTRFMAVRFGNVIGSSGSVIPIFQEQIARGGPVTVTHPEVTRYFMSIPEAAQLILQAGAMGEGGEIFILDMGKPVKIVEMARDLIRLHGFEPDQDILIEFIGLRPGEKLYEELITEGEGIVATAHEKILVLRGKSCDLESLKAGIEELCFSASRFDGAAIKKKLHQLVEEYNPHF